MQKLMWHDLQWCLRRCPAPLLEILKRNPAQVFVAGGMIRSCVTNEPINDIDVFAPSKHASKLFARELADPSHEIIETENAYTVKGLRLSVQFIHRWTFTKPEEAIDSFDFTIAMAAFWFDDGWKSIVGDRFYADLAGHRLIYRSPKRNEDAGGSLLRVLKFYQRGYRIPLDSLGAVVARLMQGVEFDKLNPKHEPMLAKVITGLLREVDPLVDAEHIAHLPAEEDAAPEAEPAGNTPAS